jgi:acyl-CoA reductase-like NAD-dependent aldehyde dehydrogenase
MKKAITDNEVLISDALYKDFGKSAFETYATETGSIIEEINNALRNLKEWMAPVPVKNPLVLFRSESKITYDPYGSVLIIGAWNYPFALTLIPLVGAIAAGNCVVLKPSEMAHHSSHAIARILRSTFDEEHVSVIEGGVDVCTELLKQRFDYIFFTGGAAVGRIVAMAAAKNLTPVTLELGGKSPCIVDDDEDIAIASKRIVWGKFINAGQTCIAPDYILVNEDVKEKLIENLKRNIESFYGDDPRRSPDYCRIINKKHFQRLTALIEKKKVVYGGQVSKTDLYISPTIMDFVSWDDKVMQEEIFGPILPILTYEDIDEAIDEISKRDKPLAIYLFSDNKKVHEKVMRNTSSGGLCINATILHTSNPNLPFGGVGKSGMGNYHGKNSFLTFSHEKAVMKKSPFPDLDVSYPPYRGKLKLLKKIWGDGLLK